MGERGAGTGPEQWEQGSRGEGHTGKERVMGRRQARRSRKREARGTEKENGKQA